MPTNNTGEEYKTTMDNKTDDGQWGYDESECNPWILPDEPLSSDDLLGTEEVSIEDFLYEQGGEEGMLCIYEIFFVDVVGNKVVDTKIVAAKTKEEAILEISKPDVDVDPDDIKMHIDKRGSVKLSDED